MQLFICLVLEKLIILFCGNNFVKKCFHESLGNKAIVHIKGSIHLNSHATRFSQAIWHKKP
jgi:hypothetical protein